MKKKIIIIVAVVFGLMIIGGIYVFNNLKANDEIREASSLVREERYEAALEKYKLVLEKEPNNEEANDMEKILKGYLRAEENYKNGDLEKAKLAIENLDDYNKYEISKKVEDLKNTIKEKEDKIKKEAEKKKKLEEEKKKEEQKKAEEKRKAEEAKNSEANRNRYFRELDELTRITEGYITGQTQADMNSQSGEVYKMWDNKINEIWKVLEKKLPKSRMDPLRKEQIAWIKKKDVVQKEIEKEYAGGSILPLKINTDLAWMTRDRCYYLIQYYM